MATKPRKRPRRRRGTGSYFPDGAGYRVVLSLGVVDGKRQLVRARARDEREAEVLLERMLRAHASGAQLARSTVGEYLTRWLEDHGPDVRQSTLTSYEGHVRNHISPMLGGIELARLQPADVRRLKSHLLTHPRVKRKHPDTGKTETVPLSPAAVARILTTLRIALGQAVRDRIIADNPADAVQLPRVEREPVEALTEARADEIIAAVRGSHIEALVVLLLGSGLRLGEAIGLDWRDVDLEQGYVIVRRTKTQVRAVPISADAVEALTTHRSGTLRRLPTDPVFRSPRRSRTTRQIERLRGDTVTHMFPRLLEEAGLPRMRVHDLRHGVATLLVSQGVHMRVVAEQLGHRNPALTARTYSHVVPQVQREAVDLLARKKGA